jgi:hypothetical protein
MEFVGPTPPPSLEAEHLVKLVGGTAMANNENNPIPANLEQELSDLEVPINPEDLEARLAEKFETDPRPSNADNTAVDSMGGIHSGSAIPDPIGDTLEGETDAESREYYAEDILDADPLLGSPQGVANEAVGQDALESIADEDENVQDRIDQIRRELGEMQENDKN